MIALPMSAGPEKPKWGEPCNGCGRCCHAELCPVGRALYGDDPPAPCPAMEFDGSRFWCGAIRLADATGFGPYLRLAMGIGMGCDSTDPEGV